MWYFLGRALLSGTERRTLYKCYGEKQKKRKIKVLH